MLSFYYFSSNLLNFFPLICNAPLFCLIFFWFCCTFLMYGSFIFFSFITLSQDFQIFPRISLAVSTVDFSKVFTLSSRFKFYQRVAVGQSCHPMASNVAFNCSATSGSFTFSRSNLSLVNWGLTILLSLSMNDIITRS